MRGFRAIIRGALYTARKYDLGCPTEAKCGMYAADQEKACVACPKHLKPVEPMVPPTAYARLRFLTRLESMVAVGCRFQMDDLRPDTWQELVWMNVERDRMDKKIREGKDGKKDGLDERARREQAKARALDKIPPPGTSLFKRGAR